MSTDIYDKNKILYALMGREQDIIQNPVSVEIQPTNNCPYNCTYCAYKNRRKSAESIDYENMNKLIDDLIQMKTKSVCISGGGEPTVYPFFDEMVDRLYQGNIQLSLLTNGLNRKVILRNASKFKYIVFHISSTDPVIYHSITGGNIESVIDIANEIKETNNSTLLEAKIIITEETKRSLTSTIKDLQLHNFDRIIISPCYDYEVKGDYVVDIEKIREELANEMGLDNIHFSNKNCNSYAEKCFMAYNNMHALIFATGDVKICPSSNILDIGRIGNISEERFENLWRSEKHKEVIRLVNQNYTNHKCRLCRFMDYNIILENIYKLEKNPHVYFI